MFFDIERLDQDRSYKLLASTVVPRPIAWVVSQNAEGQRNAAPFSFFNFFAGSPPVVAIGMALRSGEPKDSLRNLRSHSEFVVNLVTETLGDAMNATSGNYPPEIDEIEVVGLQTAQCVNIRGVRIQDSPVALECRLWQEVPIPPNMVLVLAHVVGLHVADEAVKDRARCHIDAARLHLIGRMESPGTYTRTRDRFTMLQPDRKPMD